MRNIHRSAGRPTIRTGLLALSISLALAGMSYADGVLDKVPEGALAIVKVSNLSQTSGKIAKLAEKLGVQAFLPPLSDPLGALKKQLKVTGGLKDDGELAFIYMDPKGAEEGKSMLVLVPTTDYAALTGNIEGATKDGDITITKGSEGQDVFIADWKNGYAAVSPIKALVATAPTSFVKIPPRAAKELAANDLALFGNFDALREQLTADLTKNRTQAKQQMLDEMKAKGEVPEKYHPAAAAAFDQVFNAVEAFVRDTDAGTVGFKIGENGISENVVAEFKEGSYLGKLASDLKSDNTTLLNSLPLGKYLMYGGSSISPKVVSQLIDDGAGPIIAALPPDEELKIIPDYIDSVKKLTAEIKSMSFGLVAPQGAVGQDAIIQGLTSLQGDGTKISAQIKEMNDKYSKVMSDLVSGATAGAEMKQTTTPNAKEIDGVKFDLVTTEFLGDSQMANQQRQAMQFMYGAPKVDAYIGNAGDQVLTFVGASEDSVKALVAAAKAKSSPLAELETVKAVQKELPPKRIAEAYIQLDEILGFALRTANQFGFVNGTIQMPPDLQPIGASFSSDGSSLELNYYVSDDLLQAVVSFGLQASQMMQGGGGGNGGGL